MHGDLGMIGKDDGVLAISFSGESEELIKLLPHIKRFDIPLVAMARSKNSTLGRYADVFLSIDVSKEACPLNTAPTSSTTLTLALGDALGVCLMEKRGFKKEDFASFHPGGSLGKKLFIKVKDIMQTSELPICDETVPPAMSYAGKNPKTIDDKNTLASDALKIVEQHKIQILAVTNKNKIKKDELHRLKTKTLFLDKRRDFKSSRKQSK